MELDILEPIQVRFIIVIIEVGDSPLALLLWVLTRQAYSHPIIRFPMTKYERVDLHLDQSRNDHPPIMIRHENTRTRLTVKPVLFLGMSSQI